VRVAVRVALAVEEGVRDAVRVAVDVEVPLRVVDGVGVRHLPTAQTAPPVQSSSLLHSGVGVGPVGVGVGVGMPGVAVRSQPCSAPLTAWISSLTSTAESSSMSKLWHRSNGKLRMEMPTPTVSSAIVIVRSSSQSPGQSAGVCARACCASKRRSRQISTQALERLRPLARLAARGLVERVKTVIPPSCLTPRETENVALHTLPRGGSRKGWRRKLEPLTRVVSFPPSKPSPARGEGFCSGFLLLDGGGLRRG
jgi:hypothetical protein